MTWRHEFVLGAQQDLIQIRRFVESSARSYGDPPNRARVIARARLDGILASADALTQAPYQGTRCPELGTLIRRVTKDRAIFYFEPDETRRVIRILAIFFGGQDHDTRILTRLPPTR